MTRKFKSGDLVKLISDIPSNTPMAVNCYKEDECPTEFDRIYLSPEGRREIKCVWRDKEDKPHERYYDEDALIICSPFSEKQ